MKKIIYSIALCGLLVGCKTLNTSSKSNNTNEVNVTLDLVNVVDDKIKVTLLTPKFNTPTATFNMPKIVPGTYSSDDYGKFIEGFKAFDEKGNALMVTKKDVNSYIISSAEKLNKVTYLVNDTYDNEKSMAFGGEDIFSPAGTNILKDKNFVLNTHGFVGYFTNKEETPYTMTILHPESLTGVSAMTDLDNSTTSDVFKMPKYAKLVEMPLMYAKPDVTTFMVDDMEIIISVYSPTGKYKAADITPNMEAMMKAQKAFLGDFDATKKYAILLYLSEMGANDAKGFGALEHPTSTTVVMPETMSLEMLQNQLKDVVSHEFFHIVTPLTVHSEEIENFDFNTPKMSEHLWMYEGVTEYFANLFQVNQGLITEEDFYKRMTEKIEQAAAMNDNMSFTKMSKNVLEQPYKDEYLNVYQKGALIAMCVDILIREESNGERGILNLMEQLSKEYGTAKGFKDSELFDKITSLTYPSVGAFLNKYVAGDTPIPYVEFFAKMGVTKSNYEKTLNPWLKGQMPYITINPSTNEIVVLPNTDLNLFFNSLNIKGKDVLVAINGTNYNKDNVIDMVMSSEEWEIGDDINVKIKRDGKEMEMNGKVQLPTETKEGYTASDNSKKEIRNAWLKN